MNQVPAEEFRPGIDGELTGKETGGRRQVKLREPEQGGRILLTKARKAEAEGGSLRVGGETRRTGKAEKRDRLRSTGQRAEGRWRRRRKRKEPAPKGLSCQARWPGERKLKWTFGNQGPF